MTEEPRRRERKRRAAIRHVQAVALDLFDEHGFAAVTIEQVAAAADVSPSSVYRYFGTKEGIILSRPDEGLIRELRELSAEGHPMIEALRRTIAVFVATSGDGGTLDRRRVRYLMEVPSVQAAVARRFFSDTSAVAEYLAGQMGRPAHDLEVQIMCGALYGGIIGTLRHWHATNYVEPLGDLLDKTLTALEKGLHVDRR
ncbi:TetR/AcrR family transcriptional regulator [Nonomuraea rubra]|uniref:AcrR family transcriptional regulator n=1 Tax=Nonomuraea rubra TaxID=46180 RepID=A0A7X0NP59_9ACTN|nr:TetR family transcriptional regulator [Nonomuraea rubra]MBB6546965.1 AcrR family transcriptional regulator [Nonomuraea rubra]